MKISWRYAIPSLLIAASLVLAGGCAGGPAATQAPVETGEVQPTEVPPTEVPPAPTPEPEPVVLRVGGVKDIDCWHPFACAYIWDFGDLIFEGFSGHGSWESGCAGVPRLAKSMEMSEDGLTWTIHLNKGIKFSDGTPLNAYTVEEYIDWIMSTDIAYWYYETIYMDSYKALDELTFQFTTQYPITNFPDFDAVWMWILPPHIWGETNDETMWNVDYSRPVGSGPYELTDYVPGEYMIFDALEDYYQGKPPVDRIVYQIYSNTDAVIQALIASEIDATTRDMTPQYYDTLTEAENITVVETPPGIQHFLAFNMYAAGNKNPAIEDLAVRTAIDYAINRQQIVDTALLGHGVACPNNYACGAAWEDVLNPDLQVTPFDLEEAKQILADAGYTDSDGDGVREGADGTRLEFRLSTTQEIPTQLTMADLIVDWLGEIGIALDVEAQEVGTQTDLVFNQRDFDLAMISATPDIDPGVLDFALSCWAADAGSSAWNFAGYCNEDLDNLVFGYMTTVGEDRWQPMFEAQAIINEQRPYLNIAGENVIQAYRSDRFVFPHDFCGEGLGLWNYPSVLQIEVK
jgi:peptide/nickel transport system substrate-binding protein